MKAIKIIVSALLSSFTIYTYAQICPPVSELAKSLAHGWKMYDSETNLPLSGRRKIVFTRMAKQFVLAEWAKGKNGRIHCFYRDENGSNLEAYLGKNNFLPRLTNHYWYAVTGYLQCAADSQHCDFTETHSLHKTYLARK